MDGVWGRLLAVRAGEGVCGSLGRLFWRSLGRTEELGSLARTVSGPLGRRAAHSLCFERVFGMGAALVRRARRPTPIEAPPRRSSRAGGRTWRSRAASASGATSDQSDSQFDVPRRRTLTDTPSAKSSKRPGRSAVKAKADQPPKPVRLASVNSCTAFSERSVMLSIGAPVGWFFSTGILPEKRTHGVPFGPSQLFLIRGSGISSNHIDRSKHISPDTIAMNPPCFCPLSSPAATKKRSSARRIADSPLGSPTPPFRSTPANSGSWTAR